MKRIWGSLILVTVMAAGCSSAVAEPTPPAVYDTGIDPAGWALVPAGEFLMGLNDEEVMVQEDYEIMITDVTNAQYAAYLNEALAAGDIHLVDHEVLGYYPGDEFRGHRHEEEIAAGDWPHLSLESEGLRLDLEGPALFPKAGYENHPMVEVTWFGARAYCEHFGWRLPTEVEWEKAARGTDGRPFPWGFEIERNQANFYSSHDLFEKMASGAGDTTPIGFFNGRTYDGYATLDGSSPYGLYDMAGNVWQWTGDVYDDQHYRFMRGGSKETYAYNLRVWTRNSAGPSYHSPSVGFRCARDL